MLSLWLTNLYDLWILTHTRTHRDGFRRKSWNTNDAKKGRDSHAGIKGNVLVSKRANNAPWFFGLWYWDPHSALSIQTARQNEQNWHESRATRKRDRASPLSERKGGQLAVTRRTCLTNYPAQLQRRYTLLRNRIHKRCSSNVAPPRVVELPEDSHFIFFFSLSLFFYFVLICFCLSLLGYKRT